MADGLVQLQPDGTGKKIDTSTLTVGSDDVHRQRVQIGGDGAEDLAAVTDEAPASDALGLVVRLAGGITVEPGEDPVTVEGSVEVSASALPTGAATEATLAAISAQLPSALATDRLKVDGSGVTQPVSLASAVSTYPQAVASGGASPFRYISASGSNQDATQIKGSAGQLYGLWVTNINAAIRYLKLYDSASGVTSASTPVLTLGIPGNTAGAGGIIAVAVGIAFASGIQFRLTTGVADNDANAVASGELLVSAAYK